MCIRDRSKFATETQRPNESIRAFHSRLRTAWYDAFAREEEPWLFDGTAPPPGHVPGQPGEASKVLIGQFLRNLRSDVVRVHLRNHAHMRRQPYNRYSTCLEDALFFSYSYGQLNAERRRLQAADRTKVYEPIYDSPNVHYSFPKPTNNQRGGHNDEVPMEIGYVKRGKRKGKKQGRKKRRGNLNATYADNTLNYCKFHKSEKHTDEQCRAQKSPKGKGPNSSSNNGRWKNTNPSQRKQQKRGNCHNCGKAGHWKNECRSAPRGEKPRHLAFLDTVYEEGSEVSSETSGDNTNWNS